jgi:hypothetical protein
METAQLGTLDAGARTNLSSVRWTPSSTRAPLEQLLSLWLAPECTSRLWSDTWETYHVMPSSLQTLLRLYGVEIAALAVAAGLTEDEIQQHLQDGRRPDRGVLEMLADLNCFPHVTPAARPMVGH